MSEPTKARKWVPRAAWSLVLGVATTLVIAWPITVGAMRLGWVGHNHVANRSQAFSRGGPERFIALTSWRVLTGEVRVIRPHPRSATVPVGEPTVLPGWVLLPEETPDDLRASVNFVTTTATGLPWRCLASEEYGVWHRMSDGVLATEAEIKRPPASGITTMTAVRNKWRLGGFSPSNASVGVPLRVVWPGMVLNTLTWGGAWFAALALVGRWRASRRRREGQCSVCGYDRLGLDTGAPCPECGRAAA